MNSLQVTVEPTAEPLGLDEAKEFLRVDHSDEDALILSFIAAAREYCETVTGRHFTTRTVKSYWDEWPKGNVLDMPRPFTDSTASPVVKYYAEGSTSATTLAASSYWVDNQHEPGRIVLRSSQSWPSTALRTANAVEVTFTTGYGPEADVPEGVKHAMRLLVSHWYANREAVLTGTISKTIEYGVHWLLGPHMVAQVP